jgi:hypothetical protein
MIARAPLPLDYRRDDIILRRRRSINEDQTNVYHRPGQILHAIVVILWPPN